MNMTGADSRERLGRHRTARLHELRRIGPFLGASLYRTARRCGARGCHCAQPQGEGHPVFLLSAVIGRERKKTTLYVPPRKVREVQQAINRYKRLKRIGQEITDLGLRLLRAEARAGRERRRRGR